MASRPAQGNNSIAPLNRPRPAYKSDSAPRVVSRGSVSKPTPLPSWKLGRNVADVTPTKVTL